MAIFKLWKIDWSDSSSVHATLAWCVKLPSLTGVQPLNAKLFSWFALSRLNVLMKPSS